MRVLATAVAIAGSLAACATASAAPAKVDYSDTFTTQLPNSPAGRVERVTVTHPEDPDAKPPVTTRIVMRLPKGARFDTGAVRRCEATDAELMAQGAAACPAASRIGTDLITIDSGLPVNRFYKTDVVFFNAKDAIIILNREQQTGAYVVVRGTVRRTTMDLPFPTTPGTPPDGGAFKAESALFFEATSIRNGKRRSFLTTPPECPPRGFWVLRETHTYSDGSSQTLRSPSPCVRPGAPPKKLRIAFYRRQSAQAGRPWTMRIHASRAAEATVRVLDGERSLARRRVGLSRGNTKVRMPAVAAGSYTVAVTARTADGRGAKRSARLIVR